jgi:hypothetical protein
LLLTHSLHIGAALIFTSKNIPVVLQVEPISFTLY